MSLLYESPLSIRYASTEMKEIFSSSFKYRTWRKLWLTLAEAQQELGLKISDDQLEEMRTHLSTIDFDQVRKYEKETRHEVMAHLHAFGEECPKARGILHLGATSSYVMDNGDLIALKTALQLLKGKLILLIEKLNHLSLKHAATPCLGYTHLQVAQVTTFGKRSALWLQDFLTDFKELLSLLDDFPFLGCKGAIGTQSSFLSLFGGDHQKVIALDDKITQKLGFTRSYLITSQTFPRKLEQQIHSLLSLIASSSEKCGTDLRLLSSFGEVEEDFGEKQVGSSAMPYKRNPIFSERICGLARFVKSLWYNGAENASHQWLERSLDDSSNRRMSIPEAFLATDSIINLLCTILGGLQVFPNVMKKRIDDHLPYLSTETLLAAASLKGMDRQEAHEICRKLTFEASQEKKKTGVRPELMKPLLQALHLTEKELAPFLSHEEQMGRAKHQVLEFLKLEVEPLLSKHLDLDTLIPKVEY
ncbi:MAG: adenylosuccinate lyase [Chlamydiia bacterium]|nr:adenylosuccinate lyase [Chlamydiia bacterium]